MDITTHPKYARQRELEEQMRGIGFSRQKKFTTDAVQNTHESTTTYGNRFLMRVIDPLSKSVSAFCADVMSGKPGRRATAGVYLNRITPDAAAYLIGKTVIDAMSKGKSETKVAVDIGRAVEEECRFQFYHTENPALFDTIMRDHKRRRVGGKRSVAIMKGRMNKAGIAWLSWPESHCLQIGMQGIEWMLTLDVAGQGPLVKREDATIRAKRTWKPAKRLVLADGIEALIADLTEHTALLTPGFLPSVIQPKPWRAPYGGGYMAGVLDKRTLALVKTADVIQQKALAAAPMPDVYHAVNIVQNTAWRVNSKVLAVMEQAWQAGLAVGTLACFENEAIPDKPTITPPCKYGEPGYKEWQLCPDGKNWKSWRRLAAATHEANIKNKSRRLQAAQTLSVARMMCHESEIFFPHVLDFRSRLYALPVGLHPQGPDYARSLLTFAHGEQLGIDEAAMWLAIHGANSFGIDKVSFQDRCDWVAANAGPILRSAADPLGYRWWMDAENPWQFLAFCFEWAGYGKEGLDYVSSLPISLDGTCNGLQHFSAMLRDEIGGAAVNLVPSEVPQDVYQQVADKVNEYLKEDTQAIEGLVSYVPLAEQWLRFGVTRKLTKRPVMILPYGGTQYACRKYVEEFVMEQILEKHVPNPFGQDVMPAVIYLTKLIWQAISTTAVSAISAMRWLRAVSALLVKAGHAVEWTTPAGFPVRQAYVDLEPYRITLMVGNKRVWKQAVREALTLDKDEQVNGLPPNFVHSLDAAALMGCTIASYTCGIVNFCMVHDSFGTLASRTGKLADTLRRAFVDMYTQHDALAELAAVSQHTLGSDVVLPPLPPKGVLDIESVMASKFFFA